MAEFNDGTFEMIGCAMEVHRQIGPGLREKPYENAMEIALSKAGFRTEQQKGYPIFFDGQIVGDCIPDLTVNRLVLIDVKSVDAMGENETAQMLNYLRISGLKIGLVINFKNPKIEWKRLVM